MTRLDIHIVDAVVIEDPKRVYTPDGAHHWTRRMEFIEPNGHSVEVVLHGPNRASVTTAEEDAAIDAA